MMSLFYSSFQLLLPGNRFLLSVPFRPPSILLLPLHGSHKTGSSGGPARWTYAAETDRGRRVFPRNGLSPQLGRRDRDRGRKMERKYWPGECVWRLRGRPPFAIPPTPVHSTTPSFFLLRLTPTWLEGASDLCGRIEQLPATRTPCHGVLKGYI